MAWVLRLGEHFEVVDGERAGRDVGGALAELEHGLIDRFARLVIPDADPDSFRSVPVGGEVGGAEPWDGAQAGSEVFPPASRRLLDLPRLVLQGSSTAEIAEALRVSLPTVQQHLRSIFEKTGVRSRRELVGKVFFAHHEPRLRDRRADG
jgi:hypothetical protein